MLMAVKKLYRFLILNIKCNLLSALEYKKSFIIQTIFMFINDFFFLIFWLVVFKNNNGNIDEVTINDILYLWSIPAIAYGIAYFIFGGVSDLGKYLIEGTLDSFLLQPKNIILNVATSRGKISAFGDLIYGLIMGIIAVNGNILKYIVLVLVGAFCSIFYMCTETIIRLLTVWIGNTDNIENIYICSLLITFSTYPEKIYDGLVKTLIYTIIPSAYIAFVPIRYILTFDVKELFILFVAASIYIALTAIICKKALIKYESGNSMGLRS